MSNYVVTDAFGRSPDDDAAYPGDLAQRIRARRFTAFGKAEYGKCWRCGAVGETYRLGQVQLCGDHRDAAERISNERT